MNVIKHLPQIRMKHKQLSSVLLGTVPAEVSISTQQQMPSVFLKLR